MASKPKRNARGIVAWVIGCQGVGLYLVKPGATWNPWADQQKLAVLSEAQAHRAGCPRLKPGEVKKVRVVIEEVK